MFAEFHLRRDSEKIFVSAHTTSSTNNWSYRVRINLSLLQEDSSKNSLEVEKHPPMELFANSA